MRKVLSRIILVGICIAAIAWPSGQAKAAVTYQIDDYRTEVEVTKENTYKVVERIEVYFPIEQHGIYRYIPFRYPNRPTLYSRIENISVSDKSKISTADEQGYRFVDIRIGDPERYVTGKVEYKLRYDFLVGKFEGDQYISYNLMGNMDTEIQKGSFRLTFPKPIDETKIQFYQGEPGSTIKGNINYTYEEANGEYVLSGALKGSLGATEYLTLNIPVPSDYFAAAPVLKSNYEALLPVVSIGTLLAFAAVVWLWYRYGRDKKITSVVEFYSPEELTPLELYKVYKEEDTQIITAETIKESTSLIYYLANKGYLTIHFMGKEDFQLQKTNKVPVQEKKHIEIFLKELFSKGDQVSKEELEKDFYAIGSAALLALPDQNVIDGKSVALKTLGIILTVIPFLVALYGLFDHLQPVVAIFIAIVSGISALVAILAGYGLEKRVSGIRKGKIGFALLLLIAMGIGNLVIYILSPLVSLMLLFNAMQLSLCIAAFIRKRNDEVNLLLGRIAGFREFLLVAKKNELEKLIMDNPYYFYDVLPYAHVLGVSKIFAEKFQGMNIQTPLAYSGDNMVVNYWLLYHQLSILNHMANTSYLNQQQINRSGFSGGGFGGGGGFSGGGFGGGGGGSW